MKGSRLDAPPNRAPVQAETPQLIAADDAVLHSGKLRDLHSARRWQANGAFSDTFACHLARVAGGVLRVCLACNGCETRL
jgi:hypothetical protein